MTGELIGTVATAFGGIELIKFGVGFFWNRYTNKRKEVAGAVAVELDNQSKEKEIYQDHITFLTQQLQERNIKFDALYKEHERLAERTIELITERGELLVKIKEAEYARCDINNCTDRRPPRIYSYHRRNKPKTNNDENK